MIDKIYIYLPLKGNFNRYIILRVMVDQSGQLFGAKLGVSVVCPTSYLLHKEQGQRMFEGYTESIVVLQDSWLRTFH